GGVGADLLGEVGQRRAARHADDGAVAAGRGDAADRRRLHVVELLAPLLLGLATADRLAARATEGAGRAAAAAPTAGASGEPTGRATATGSAEPATSASAAARARTAAGARRRTTRGAGARRAGPAGRRGAAGHVAGVRTWAARTRRLRPRCTWHAGHGA